jgi:hypothetical protein
MSIKAALMSLGQVCWAISDAIGSQLSSTKYWMSSWANKSEMRTLPNHENEY